MNYRHGQARAKRQTKEYRAWACMLSRCYNPNVERYPHYGGRGIKVCERWRNSFVNFFHDIGEAPSRNYSVDRVDNNGHYEPGNVRWAAPSEQIRNSRKARYLTHEGATKTIGDWSRDTGINRQTIQARLDQWGWSIGRALTTPTK